jgi:hypothetical protein
MTARRRPLSIRQLAVLILLTVLLPACGSTLYYTGEGLAALGNRFADTGELYNDLYQAKQITPEQYGVWAAFATTFKAVYPRATALWKRAKAQYDQELARKTADPSILREAKQDLGQAESLLRSLALGLSRFTRDLVGQIKKGD